MYVDRERQPRATDRQSRLFVDDEDICPCMVELDHLEWPCCAQRAGNRSRRLHGGLVATPPGTVLQVDILDTRLDRASMRRLETRFHAARLDHPHQLRDGWAIGRQEDCADGALDEFVPPGVKSAMAEWPAALAFDQSAHAAAFAEETDQPIGGCLTEAEFNRQCSDISRGALVAAMIEKCANCVGSPSSFFPLSIINLVGKRIFHKRPQRRK